MLVNYIKSNFDPFDEGMWTSGQSESSGRVKEKWSGCGIVGYLKTFYFFNKLNLK